MNTITALLFLVLTIGCTTAYKHQPDAPTAKLTLMTENLRNIPFGNSFVTVQLLDETQRCNFFRVSPSIEANLNQPSITVPITANKKMYISVTYKARYYLLLDYVSRSTEAFTPKEGEHYHIKFEVDPSGTYWKPGENTITYYKIDPKSKSEVGFKVTEWGRCP